jgi:fructokinase
MRESKVGRRARVSLRIGIDVGGTKIEGIALEGSDEIARLRVSTPRDDYTATLEAIASITSELEARAGGHGSVGIGIPGTISPTSGLVKNANSVWLIGRPLRDDLCARLSRPVRIENDANCFAVSEAADGAAAGAHVVFGVILGTGTGGGIVVGGHVLTGPNGLTGEWGHNPLPWPGSDSDEQPGPPCYCGKRGCIETYLSGPALSADHERHTGHRCAAAEVIARAADHEPDAEETLRRYAGRAARALASIINVLDPEIIVLGGGLSNMESLYARLPDLWGRWVFAAGSDEVVRTRLVRARHGDSSGVRGAAWLWPDA